MEDRRFALKLLTIISALALVFFSLEVWWDISHAVDPETGGPISWDSLTVTPLMIRTVASPFARAYNNILAIFLTFIAIAIPITANLYTPKLIEIFARDRINLIVLSVYALLTAHSILAITLSFDNYAAQLPFWIDFVGAMVGWIILLPYYFYVLSFLNPTTIIQRVTQQVLLDLRTVARGTRPIASAQQHLNQRILHLGSVLLRAVERTDRDVSIEAIKAHMRVLRKFHKLKPRIDPKFLEVDDTIMVGISSGAVGLLNRAQTWVEQKVLTQVCWPSIPLWARCPTG
jgi:hypothetical protein